LGAILVTSPQRLAAKAAAHECSCAVDGRFGAWKLIAEAVEELAAKKGLGVRRYYQRTNENTNGLLRQYFPKGTNFLSIPELPHSIALRLNQRPRKTLGFETPTNKLRKVLH
jgi:hypothetical protein